MVKRVSTWLLVEPISDMDAIFLKNTSKKLRFLGDENINKNIIEELKNQKWVNAKHIYYFNMAGVPDKKIFALARKTNRIILTHDRDFLDDHEYPLFHFPGVITLPESSGNPDVCLLGLAWACITFKDQHNLLVGSKVSINPEEGMLKVKQRTWDGKISNCIFDLKNGRYKCKAPKVFEAFTPEEKRLMVVVLMIMRGQVDNESVRVVSIYQVRRRER